MKKIEFKKVNYGDYEVYLDNVKTNFMICNWKKDLNCYTVFDNNERISGFEYLAQAKDFVKCVLNNRG